MATGVTTPTGSQPAKSSSEILSSLNAEQTREWRSTGKLPDEKSQVSKESTEAASSPAAKEPTEPPAKATETPAGSVPALKEPPKKAEGAPERIKELLSENKQLRTKLEELQKVPVAAAKKDEAPAKPQRTDVDPKTGQLLYANDEAFEQAREEYLTKKITADVQKQTAKAAEEARIAEQNKLVEQRWLNSIKIATEKYPDFVEVMKRDDKGVFHGAEIKLIQGGSLLDRWILDSEVSGEILYYLETHPGEVVRIQALGAFQGARELTRIEEKLSAAPSAPVKKSEEVPPAKRAPGAPAPAADVSGKSTAPVDSLAAAVSKGNFAAYQKEANDEDARKRKR